MFKLKTFYNQFAKPEFKSIAGKFYKNLLIVSLIFLLSLLAIGFGRGMINYLSNKMQDPFIKFFDVVIPASVSRGFKWEDLNTKSLQSKYLYDNVSPIYNEYMDFRSVNDEIIDAKTRKIKSSSKFYKFLVNDPEIMLTEPLNNTFANDSWSIIVTKAYLKELGYEEENFKKVNFLPFVNVIYGKDRFIPIPVAAIVSQLPNHNDVLISERLYEALKQDDIAMDITSERHNNYLRFFIDTTHEAISTLADQGFIISDNTLAHTRKGLILTKNGVESPADLFDDLKQEYSNVTRLYDLDRSFKPLEKFDPQVDIISFPFNSLDSIYRFEDYLINNYEISINMQTIENKKNFYLFNNIAHVLSSALILFSILMVIFFITNIILTHIERNKKNLGTLKAFGLSNRDIVLIYSSIGAFLVIVAFAIALVLSWLTGNPFMDLLINLINMDVNQAAIHFEFFSIWLAAAFFIVLPNIFIYLRLKSALSRQTPGDLIYERN
ncbi:MAG: FtsX-like permease family protein [bacterium]